MELLYVKEHFSCHNYDKGQNARLEIIKERAGFALVRNLTDIEIIFILKGKLTISYGKIMNLEIEGGKIMLFPPGARVVGKLLEDTHFVIFRIRAVSQLCDCMSLERLYSSVAEKSNEFRTLNINERMNAFIEMFVVCVNDGLKCTYYFATKTRELFFLLRAYYTKEELAGFFNPILGRDASFMNLMYRNYFKVSNIQQLADLSNYSLSGFKKQFRKVFGISPTEWMTQQKASKIFQDINTSDFSFKEIADIHGFSSVSSFSNFCLKNFGMPPGKIRLNVEKMLPKG